MKATLFYVKRITINIMKRYIRHRFSFISYRVTRAYKNMENPECIIVDASRSIEQVCENTITELKNRKIWPDDNIQSTDCI